MKETKVPKRAKTEKSAKAEKTIKVKNAAGEVESVTPLPFEEKKVGEKKVEKEKVEEKKVEKVEAAQTIEVARTAITPSTLHFIEGNSIGISMDHLKNDCIIPVFAKDNELTISHAQFVDMVSQAAHHVFKGETISDPVLRASHIIKGRTPEALYKPADELKDAEKTIYYERCAFSIDIPTIYSDINGNKVYLSIVGVRAYNQMNLYSKKSLEVFKLAIGFKNQVCCNMCISTDGFNGDFRVSSVQELYHKAAQLFMAYEAEKQLGMMRGLVDNTMTEHQFCQVLGRMRLYQCLPTKQQRQLPELLLTDTQINAAARAYINDDNFKAVRGRINMWQFYNLLTSANKCSYIDLFMNRAANATELAVGINKALQGDKEYRWFIS